MRLLLRSALLLALLVGTVLLAEAKPVAAADDWYGWAATAWKYFTPDIHGGVNPTTGLNRGSALVMGEPGSGWDYLTDWELATYILAILHAKDLGLIQETGLWGASDRLDKVMKFLEERPLNSSNGLPYWSYRWDVYPYAYNPYDHGPSRPGDAGLFLISLYLVKQAYPSRASKVDAIVDRVRDAFNANYFDASGRLKVGYDFYTYCGIAGFDQFNFDMTQSKKALEEALAAPPVPVYGQSLARVFTTAEPFLLCLFELQMDSRFQDYAYRTYKAMEGRFNNTGILTAWSESYYEKDPGYIYEWVVTNTGKTWQLNPETTPPLKPLITSKAAFGYHALYRTPYTQNLVGKLLPKVQNETLGFTEGAFESANGEIGNSLQTYSDKTNSLIMAAAEYALSFRGHPSLFVPGGTATATVVLGASKPHSPCGAAHTIDVVGTNLLAASLGHFAHTGGMDAMMDTQAAHWTGSAIVLDVTGDIITAGGPPVNYVWKYYNDKGTLPAYFNFNPNGTVYVPSTGHSYSMTSDYYQGKAVTDYAIVELYVDGGRNVLLVAGISGFATYYACKWLAAATLDDTIRTYDGQAIILKLYDADGDPLATPPTITVQETV